MKSFKDRVILLEQKTSVEDVKKECNRIVELSSFSNEVILRNSMLETLSGIELDTPAQKFFENETKIKTINEMNLEVSFTKLFESEVFKKNVQIQYPLNALHRNYTNGANTIYVAEQLVDILNPFSYDMIIESILTDIKSIFEKYSEDLDTIKSIFEIKSSKNGKNYDTVINLLEEHFYEKGSRRQLIEKLKVYAYEPKVLEAMKRIAEYEDKSSMFIINENSAYDVNNVYSFIYTDPEVSENVYFYNNGKYLQFNDVELKEVNENELLGLPQTFKKINQYIQGGNVKITENKIDIILNNSKIEFEINENKGNKAYLNGQLIEGNVYQSLMESKMFNALHYAELATINKIWENIDTLINIDIAQEIRSKGSFVKAIVYKVDEKFYVHKLDPMNRVNEFVSNLNGLQLRNSLYEYMRYDITEKMFEYLEGPSKEIGRLRDQQTKIQETINSYNEQLNRINYLLENDNLITSSDELIKAKSLINEEIAKLKSQYYGLEEDIKSIQNTNDKEIINEDETALKAGDSVRIKDSGVVGKVTAINTVTKEIGVLDDEGNTIGTTIDNIEKIDDKIAKTLTDIEQKAKDAEKLHFATERNERASKLFGKIKKV